MCNRLGGRAGLSAEMAIRFEQAFGLSADTLMRMPAAHDLTLARASGDVVGVDGWRLKSGISALPPKSYSKHASSDSSLV